jgi:next to BRCA1 gene 1 protein
VCTDYDLCSGCLKDVSEFHNPFHEFYEIKEPGRVVVHNVYSGTGEANTNSAQPAQTARPVRPSSESPPSPVLHNATCNLCDSRIQGDRYKCLNCPDFDTCSSCFSITKDQHPGHGFVKITKKKDLMVCSVFALSV